MNEIAYEADFSPFFDRDAVPPGEFLTEGQRKYRAVEAEEYHAWPALNNSLLKEPSPCHMLHSLMKEEKDDYGSAASAEAKTIGTLVHWATLEPHKISTIREHVIECETEGLTTKKAKQQREENPGKLLVTAEHVQQAYRLREAIEMHGEASNILSKPAEKEASGFLFEEGVWRKWRVDFLPHTHESLVDVKTTRVEIVGEHGKRNWISECWKNGYWLQAAWYLHHHEMLTGMRPRWWTWIVVSKAEPFYCRVFHMENLSPKNPFYGASMIAKARGIIGLDGAERLSKFVSAAQETRMAVGGGKPLTSHLLRQIWEACENETRGPEIGLPEMIA